MAAMNALYRQDLRLFQNLFLPSVKLQRKVRVGSRTRRYYDRPQTPLERVLACPEADQDKCARLKLLRDRLDPFEISGHIDGRIEQLQALASATRRVRRARRGRQLNIHRETSIEALRAAGAPV